MAFSAPRLVTAYSPCARRSMKMGANDLRLALLRPSRFPNSSKVGTGVVIFTERAISISVYNGPDLLVLELFVARDSRFARIDSACGERGRPIRGAGARPRWNLGDTFPGPASPLRQSARTG
jgi:hypothetical protein